MVKIKLNPQEQKLLAKHLPDVFGRIVQNADEFHMSDDICDNLFSELDYAIVDIGMINQDILNDTGRALQRLYDNLYNQINQN